MTQLHLLRGFVQWRDRRTGEDIKTIDAAESWVSYIAGRGFERFYTTTSRVPQRLQELEGGSVYFVKGGVTLFRMPLVEVEIEAVSYDGREREADIAMSPQLIRVEHKRVGMVRGWRYLKADDAPPDICPTDGGQASGDVLPAELRELGLA